MTDPDFTGLPDHPSLEVTRAMGRALFTGLPEVISMETLKSPAELREEWTMWGWPEPFKYEGGIDYERPDPPSGADGLVVVEFKEPSSP
jgi:hypothetical protein